LLNHFLNAYIFKRLQLLLASHKQLQQVGGFEDLKWMRPKRQYAQAQIHLERNFSKSLQNKLMPSMQSIKVADGKRSSVTLQWRNLLNALGD
jgi:hypothetical protein